MTDGVKLTVSNKAAFFTRLQKLAPAAVTAMGEANRQSAEDMAALARSYAPTGATGALKASIRVEPGPRPGSFFVRAGGAATTKEVRSGSGKPFDYSLAVEFGVKPHVNAGEFAGSQNPGFKREPYFWVAYRSMKRRVKSRASRAMNKAIKAVMGT